MEVKYVSSQGRVDSFKKEYPTIEDWIQLIENAKYVITNSFHGMAFSIIMNAPFIVIPLAGSFVRMNGRIYDILSMLKLKSRIYKDNLDILLSEIDFSRCINASKLHSDASATANSTPFTVSKYSSSVNVFSSPA